MKLRLRQLLISLLLLPLILTSVSFVLSQKADAITGADWKPGRIIDDAVFFNKDAMSVAQIQAFLNAKVPVCAKNHSNYSPTYPGPYTCLKDYQENTTTGESNVGRYNPDGSPYQVPGGKTAAQIIWDAAQAYTINPQTLIVMLQKEQSLVTDDWPLILQYQKAMGQSCPDTAPCDPAFAGFYNQVSGAAWQIRHYINNPQFFNYRAGVTRFVLYNPNTSCGGTNVFIENNATAALYNYTPYQPNAGALSNLYGTTNCGAYGNRNFWRLFNDWFGSTMAPNYSWQLTSQYAYTDNTKTTGVDIFHLSPGQRLYIGFKAKNMGNQTWLNNGTNPVRVGTIRGYERTSLACDLTWLSCSRPTSMTEPSVSPGSEGTFEFWVQMPEFGGSLNEYFSLLSEGQQWMPDIGMQFPLVSPRAAYNWETTAQYAYTDETKLISASIDNTSVGRRSYIGLRVKNTGNVTWKKSSRFPVRLGTTGANDRISSFCDTWLSCSRPAEMNETAVAPGETATFEFWYKPTKVGIFYERFVPMIEGYGWMQDKGLSFFTQVGAPTYDWELRSQYAYTSDLKTLGSDLSNLIPGQRVFIGLKALNTGNVAWTNTGPTPVRIGTARNYNRASVFCDISWLSCGRPSALLETRVEPGQIGTFEFWYTAPNTRGTYQEYFLPLVEGSQWMKDIGMQFYSVVK